MKTLPLLFLFFTLTVNGSAALSEYLEAADQIWKQKP